MQKPLVRWLAVIVWMVVIFAFSHQAYSGRITEEYLHDANVPIRKAGHIGEFAILYLLVWWALTKPRGENDTESADTISGAPPAVKNILVSPAAIAFVIAVAYAGTDEWHQSYVPGRSASVSDVAVDACGVALGAIALLAARRLKILK